MTGWQSRTSNIQIGDRVAYSAAWLRSTGQMAGVIGHARGVVAALEMKPDYTIAVVDWGGDPEIPTRINVANLCKVKGRGFSHD